MSETPSPAPETPSKPTLSEEEIRRRREAKRRKREEALRREQEEQKRRRIRTFAISGTIAVLILGALLFRGRHNLRDYLAMALNKREPPLMVLRNGDMTAEGYFGPPPLGWDHLVTAQGKARAFRDTTVHQGGPASFCLASEGDEPAVANAFQAIRSDGGTRITVRGVLKVEGEATGAVAVRLYRSPTESAPVVLKEIKGTSGWQEFQQEIPLPRGIIGIDVALGLNGKGKVWLDDMTFAGLNTANRIPEAIDPSVPAEGGADWKPQAEQVRAAAHAAKDAKVVFIGDSITSLWAKQPTLWNERYGKYHAVALGIPNDSTRQLLWRIQQGEVDGLSPKVVVLMVGVNNLWTPTVETSWIADSIGKIVRELRTRLPKTKVLVLGILPTQHDANFPLRGRVKAINARIAHLDDGKMIRFLDMGDKFLEPDGTLSSEVMPDYIHPAEKGYRIWADTMQPLLEEMLDS
jgi:lysophospholipase L1-like esterase